MIRQSKKMQSEFKSLEYLTQLTILDSNTHERVRNPIESINLDQAQGGSQFGILVRVEDRPNPIAKIISLLVALHQLNKISSSLVREGRIVVGRLGVYPSISDPVTVYALNSIAESYINFYVLPSFPRGFNGILRKLIMKAVGFHPSVAGLILVVRKY